MQPGPDPDPRRDV